VSAIVDIKDERSLIEEGKEREDNQYGDVV
jgi:hypothetical protein